MALYQELVAREKRGWGGEGGGQVSPINGHRGTSASWLLMEGGAYGGEEERGPRRGTDRVGQVGAEKVVVCWRVTHEGGRGVDE